MKSNALLPVLAVCTATAMCNVYAQVLEKDPQNSLSVSRPSSWINQERPSPAIRMMLGIEGDGYAGNCNLSVLSSPSTAKMSQAEVDASENKKLLGIEFFQSQLISVSSDVKILNAVQTKRGPHFGHLVNYSYSYIVPSLQRRIHARVEIFSHSRPGKVLTFTCSTGALTMIEAQRAFSKEETSFKKLAASLRIDA